MKSDEMKSGKIILKPYKRSKKDKTYRKVGQEHQQATRISIPLEFFKPSFQDLSCL